MDRNHHALKPATRLGAGFSEIDMIWLQNTDDKAVSIANTMATLARSGYPRDRLVKGAPKAPERSRFTDADLVRANLCGIYLKEG